MSAEKFYKVLGRDGLVCHGGTGVWRKNRWRGVRGPLVPCENGLHLCRAEHLVLWLGPTIWRAEYDGEMVDLDDKVVVRRARVTERIDAWNERTARLFAADCAERVLSLFESVYPGDDRPRAAIQAARDFAEARAIETATAANAAWAAEAARAAVWAAEARAIETATAANAAWAAQAATWAAQAAAWSVNAAWAAEAARAAVWAAEARAIETATAASAAWAAEAARAAAQAAEREWQTGRLLDYLDGRAG
jgi:hypothetical protein